VELPLPKVFNFKLLALNFKFISFQLIDFSAYDFSVYGYLPRVRQVTPPPNLGILYPRCCIRWAHRIHKLLTLSAFPVPFRVQSVNVRWSDCCAVPFVPAYAVLYRVVGFVCVSGGRGNNIAHLIPYFSYSLRISSIDFIEKRGLLFFGYRKIRLHIVLHYLSACHH
jgi:hypothetical protein